MAERMIEVNGVGLCTESFGDPSDPAVMDAYGIPAAHVVGVSAGGAFAQPSSA